MEVMTPAETVTVAAEAASPPSTLTEDACDAVNVSAAVLRTGEGRDPLHPVCPRRQSRRYCGYERSCAEGVRLRL